MSSGPAPVHTAAVVPGLAAEWPSLAGTGPLHASPGWLHAMAGRLGTDTLTVTVRRDGRVTLAAFASVQPEHRPGEYFDPHECFVAAQPDLPLTPASRERRAALAAGADPARWAPYLLLMLPGYDCTPVGPDATDPAALDVLVDAALGHAADAGIRTVVAAYTDPAAPLSNALRRNGFHPAPMTPSWELRLPGTGLPDYLAGLPHKRRIEARRELRRLDDDGVLVTALDHGAVDAVFEDLVRLRCELVGKYRGAARSTDVERAKLRALVDHVAAGRPHVLLATAPGGAPLGFALFAEHKAEHGPEWHCLAVGHDYADPRSRLTYFAAAYYRAAEHAYRHGVRTIGYGIGAWQAKRARGCDPLPRTGWVHTTDPVLAATVAACTEATVLTHS